MSHSHRRHTLRSRTGTSRTGGSCTGSRRTRTGRSPHWRSWYRIGHYRSTRVSCTQDQRIPRLDSPRRAMLPASPAAGDHCFVTGDYPGRYWAHGVPFGIATSLSMCQLPSLPRQSTASRLRREWTPKREKARISPEPISVARMLRRAAPRACSPTPAPIPRAPATVRAAVGSTNGCVRRQMPPSSRFPSPCGSPTSKAQSQ